jgi:hypothetical protein
MNGTEERPGRETRLLVLVIVVSLAVLFLLARFRFPPAGLVAGPPSPGPLDRLAARATYEDLASAIAVLVQRVEPSVVVVQIDTAPPEEKDKPRTSREKEKAAAPTQPPPAPRLLPGIRLRPDLALVYVPAGMRVSPAQGFGGPTSVFATDPKRELALVKVPVQGESNTGVPNVLEGFPGFSYVAVVAAMGGPTGRPVFIGRLDTSVDDRWRPSPSLIGGEPNAPAGSLVFAIDGRLIGMVLPQFGSLAIVPATALNSVVTELGGGAAGGLK